MNKRTAWLGALLLLCGSVAAQHKKTTSSKTHRHEKPAVVHYGTASFYANKFEGRKTANGEIFSQKKMTAACNIIPLNTWVRVTNVHNKKTAIVKITDRMHRDNKRLIDLSHLAAKKLAYTGRGITRVRVEVLGRKPPHDWVAEPGSR